MRSCQPPDSAPHPPIWPKRGWLRYHRPNHRHHHRFLNHRRRHHRRRPPSPLCTAERTCGQHSRAPVRPVLAPPLACRSTATPVTPGGRRGGGPDRQTPRVGVTPLQSDNETQQFPGRQTAPVGGSTAQARGGRPPLPAPPPVSEQSSSWPRYQPVIPLSPPPPSRLPP